MNKENNLKEVIKQWILKYKDDHTDTDSVRMDGGFNLEELGSMILTSQLTSLLEGLEEIYGKENSFTGSFGFQGVVMGIESYQQESDKIRDKLISLIRSKMEKKI